MKQSTPIINQFSIDLMRLVCWLWIQRPLAAQENSPTIQFHQSLMKIDWELNVLLFLRRQRSNQLSSFHQQSFNSIKKVWLIDWFVGMKLKNCWIALRCGAVLSFIKSNQLTSFNKLINKPNFFGLVELSWLMKVDWLMKEEKAAPPFLHQIKLKFYLYCGMGWPASGVSFHFSLRNSIQLLLL